MVSNEGKLPTQAEFCALHVLPLAATELRPDAGTTCTICMEVLKTTQASSNVVVLQVCSHFYHAKCILDWFNSDNQRRGECPNCRRALFLPDPLKAPPSIDSLYDYEEPAPYLPARAHGRPTTPRGLPWLSRPGRHERSVTVGLGTFEESAHAYASYNRQLWLQASMASISSAVASVRDTVNQDSLRVDADEYRDEGESVGIITPNTPRTYHGTTRDNVHTESNAPSDSSRTAILDRFRSVLLRRRRNTGRQATTSQTASNDRATASNPQQPNIRSDGTIVLSSAPVPRGLRVAATNLAHNLQSRLTRPVSPTVLKARDRARVNAQDGVRRISDEVEFRHQRGERYWRPDETWNIIPYDERLREFNRVTLEDFLAD
jgi:hypothetical protein